MCNFNAITNWLGVAIGLVAGAIALFALSLIFLAFPLTAWLAGPLQWAAVGLIGLAAVAIQVARQYSYDYFRCMIKEEPTKERKCWGQWRNLRNSYHALTVTVGLSAVALATLITTGQFESLLAAVVSSLTMIVTVGIFLNIFKSCLSS